MTRPRAWQVTACTPRGAPGSSRCVRAWAAPMVPATVAPERVEDRRVAGTCRRRRDARSTTAASRLGESERAGHGFLLHVLCQHDGWVDADVAGRVAWTLSAAPAALGFQESCRARGRERRSASSRRGRSRAYAPADVVIEHDPGRQQRAMTWAPALARRRERPRRWMRGVPRVHFASDPLLRAGRAPSVPRRGRPSARGRAAERAPVGGGARAPRPGSARAAAGARAIAVARQRDRVFGFREERDRARGPPARERALTSAGERPDAAAPAR